MSDKNSAKELRAMSAKELSALVRSLREELFNLRLQQATGQLVVVNGGKAKLSKTNFYFATGAVDAIPESDHSRRFLIADEFTTGPFGGDAA